MGIKRTKRAQSFRELVSGRSGSRQTAKGENGNGNRALDGTAHECGGNRKSHDGDTTVGHERGSGDIG